MSNNENIPAGYSPMKATKGFHDLLGILYGKIDDGHLTLGFRVSERHLNPFGGLHGGALAAFADYQLVPAAHLMGIKATNCRTITLTTDFLAPGNLGDWVELQVYLQKQTRSMVFTRGEMLIGGEPVARTTGIYRIVTERA